MGTNYAQSQVSIDDLLEYTSINGDFTPEEQAAVQAEDLLPPGIPSPDSSPDEAPATPVKWYLGRHPNTSLSAVPKNTLASQSSNRFVTLPPPTPAMLASAHMPHISERIPQDHPEWQKLRSGKVTGSSLAEFLGLCEQSAGAALSSVGVAPYMRDPAKLKQKVLSLQQEAYTSAEVSATTQVFFDWGHQHEPNGILSYLMAEPDSVVHEVGFVMLDPSLKTLPLEVRQGIDPSQLPVIGSSPDGVILQHAQSPAAHGPWREVPPSARTVLEIKAKTPFRPEQDSDLWRWLGNFCKPHNKILPQYFAQAQLNMLVTGADACHLLSHTVRQDSAIFHIPLHKQWCNQMLHWVAKLNTEYVVPGLAPPANVFWEQPEYRQFVALTKEACKGLMKAAKGVPSVNRDGPGQQPIWLGHVEHLPPAAQVPVFREEGAPHLGQQPQLHQPQQQQPQVHQPQQQQQPQEGHFMQGLPEVDQAPESQYGLGVVPDTQDQQHDWEQHLPQQQQQQQPQSEQQQLSQWLHNQPQQQQQSQLNEQQRLGQWHQYRPQQPQQQQQQQRFGQWHQLYQDSRAGQLHIQQPQLQHMRQEQVVNGAASAALRHSASLTAAAAVALPADEDEPMPDAEPAAVAVPEAASAAAPPPAAAAGPGGQGPIGAHGLSSCIQRMLHKHKVNLGDVLDYTCQAALSLLTRVDVFGVLEKLAQEVKAGWPRNPSALCMQRIKACSAPRPDAAPHPPAPTAELATSGPVGTSPAPAGPTSNGPAVYSTTSPRRPFAEGPAQGPQSFVTPGPAVRTALPSLGFNSPSPLSSAPASPAPVRPSNGPAQGTFPINSPAAGRSVYHGSVYTTTAFNASAATSTIPATPVLARRAADDFAADQPVQPGTVRPVTVTAYAHGLSNSANGNRGSATAAAAPRSFSATAPVEPFTPQQVANLSEALKQQLYSLVRDHRCFVKASDFDVYIMKKLEAMTERQALHVLQQLDRVSWATVQDPTRYIMYFCCNRAG